MEKLSILDLPKRIKTARNNGVLGKYKEALSMYKVSLDLISLRIKEITDSFLKQKWSELEAEIKSEMSHCMALYDLCSAFKTTPFDQNKPQNDFPIKKQDLLINKERSASDNKIVKHQENYREERKEEKREERKEYKRDEIKQFRKEEINDKEIKKAEEVIKKEKNSVSLGKEVIKPNKPKLEDKKDIQDDNPFEITKLLGEFKNGNGNKKNDRPIKNDDFNGLINNFNKPFSDPFEEKKDPLVWEKPINDKKPVKKESISKPVIPPKKQSNQKESVKDDKSKKKEKDKDSTKKSYLNHIYPDGNGPDSNLIEMLESEVVDQNPCVKFEDIAELQAAKNILKEAVLLPLLMPGFFKGIRRPWKGVLLYGPPGTGKTMLAKALATQGKTTFFNVSSSSFASKWRGDSEKLVRILFEMARYYAPTVIFIDEVDSIGSKRGDGECESSRRVKSEFLVQMDGCSTFSSANVEIQEKEREEKKKEGKDEIETNRIVMVLGATNRPWDLDEALIRRYEKRVYIPLPNEKGREEMFKINLKGVKTEENIDLTKLIEATHGYSGSDIANVCREASLMNMRRRLLNNSEDIKDLIGKTGFRKEIEAPITLDDLLEACVNISKSVSNDDMKKYEDWTKEFKST